MHYSFEKNYFMQTLKKEEEAMIIYIYIYIYSMIQWPLSSKLELNDSNHHALSQIKVYML